MQQMHAAGPADPAAGCCWLIDVADVSAADPAAGPAGPADPADPAAGCCWLIDVADVSAADPAADPAAGCCWLIDVKSGAGQGSPAEERP
jgi:hypothetical protein